MTDIVERLRGIASTVEESAQELKQLQKKVPLLEEKLALLEGVSRTQQHENIKFRAFIEEITKHGGKYEYLNETQVVVDANKVLKGEGDEK